MYKSGQKLICIVGGEWYFKNGTPTIGPRRGEEVTVYSVEDNYLWLVEYLNIGCFNSRGFRPPVNISEDVMESFQKEIIETIDVPIVEPTLEPA